MDHLSLVSSRHAAVEWLVECSNSKHSVASHLSFTSITSVLWYSLVMAWHSFPFHPHLSWSLLTSSELSCQSPVSLSWLPFPLAMMNKYTHFCWGLRKVGSPSALPDPVQSPHLQPTVSTNCPPFWFVELVGQSLLKLLFLSLQGEKGKSKCAVPPLCFCWFFWEKIEA